MGSNEIDEALAALYRRMRALTPAEFKALARAGRRRGPIERIAGFFGLDRRYRLLRGDPLERARSAARATFKRQRRRPPDFMRPLKRSLRLVGLAGVVGFVVVWVVLASVLDQHQFGFGDRRSFVRSLVAFVSLGAAFLAAAATADAMWR